MISRDQLCQRLAKAEDELSALRAAGVTREECFEKLLTMSEAFLNAVRIGYDLGSPRLHPFEKNEPQPEKETQNEHAE